MYQWTVTLLAACDGSGDEPSAGGAALTRVEAWADAVEATMGRVSSGETGPYRLEVDGHPGLLDPGRARDGQADLPSIRATLERMAAAATGVPL